MEADKNSLYGSQKGRFVCTNDWASWLDAPSAQVTPCLQILIPGSRSSSRNTEPFSSKYYI